MNIFVFVLVPKPSLCLLLIAHGFPTTLMRRWDLSERKISSPFHFPFHDLQPYETWTSLQLKLESRVVFSLNSKKNRIFRQNFLLAVKWSVQAKMWEVSVNNWKAFWVSKVTKNLNWRLHRFPPNRDAFLFKYFLPRSLQFVSRDWLSKSYQNWNNSI